MGICTSNRSLSQSKGKERGRVLYKLVFGSDNERIPFTPTNYLIRLMIKWNGNPIGIQLDHIDIIVLHVLRILLNFKNSLITTQYNHYPKQILPHQNRWGPNELYWMTIRLNNWLVKWGYQQFLTSPFLYSTWIFPIVWNAVKTNINPKPSSNTFTNLTSILTIVFSFFSLKNKTQWSIDSMQPLPITLTGRLNLTRREQTVELEPKLCRRRNLSSLLHSTVIWMFVALDLSQSHHYWHWL